MDNDDELTEPTFIILCTFVIGIFVGIFVGIYIDDHIHDYVSDTTIAKGRIITNLTNMSNGQLVSSINQACSDSNEKNFCISTMYDTFVGHRT
jgi:uncharacterized membrane protein YcfT